MTTTAAQTTTGYKLNRLQANRNGEFRMGYGYFYGTEVAARELVWLQGFRLDTHEDRINAYYRTADGHEHITRYTGSTTGFAYRDDQYAAGLEYGQAAAK